MADEPGTVIANRYELSEIIGRGSQGVVWRALDRETRSPVAVKMLVGPTARDRELVERMRREQSVLRTLSGTCAVAAFDFCTSPGGLPCLVMELLEGTDFDQHLRALAERQELVKLDALVELLDPVVDALERAHDAGIVHRDLKPANVFLQSVPGGGHAVRLLDFGLARVRTAQPLTAVGTLVGSPAYMAPEVWKGQPDLVDARADAYSLAVLVFRALGGKVPFDAPTLPAQLVMVTTAERPSLCALRSDLPRSVDAWMARGLAIDPAARFAEVRVMWDALRLCAQPKRRGLLGLNPLSSAWKAARSAVERIAGRPAPEEAVPPLGASTGDGEGATATPPAASAPAAAGFDAQAAPESAARTVLAPPVSPPRRARSLPHLPPPPPPRAGSSVRARPERSVPEPSEAEGRTRLWIRPVAADAHGRPTVKVSEVVVEEAAAASVGSDVAEVRTQAAAKGAPKAKKKRAADPAVKKAKPRRPSGSGKAAASRKKSTRTDEGAPRKNKKAKKR
jgi:eukaryotic-like serine/threonine-protein kinase